MATTSDLGAAGLVTPEAVVLDLPVANVGSRSLAAVVDAVALFVIFLGVSFVAGLVSGASETTSVVMLFVGVFVILFVLPVVFETVSRGRSPGKMMLGLRVVTVEGGPIGVRHAAIRAALWPVEVLAVAGGIAVTMALFTRRAQRLGDLVAGTIVVQARSPREALHATRFTAPVGLEAHTAALDVSGLTEADYEVVRSILVRDRGLADTERQRLAHDVAVRLRPRLAPPAPAGTPPLAELGAIAAAYQQRFAGRRDRDVNAWVWGTG